MATARKTFRNFHASRRAAAAVEFAFIAPLLLMMIFGIVVWGSYLAVVHCVQQLAAEAARSSIAGLSNSERASLAQAYVTANASAYPLITPQRVTVSAAASASNANVFVVTVSYDASNMFIFKLPSFVPAPPSTVMRSAAIPYGGF
jgi:Flp pilus assembly protein TadG